MPKLAAKAPVIPSNADQLKGPSSILTTRLPMNLAPFLCLSMVRQQNRLDANYHAVAACGMANKVLPGRSAKAYEPRSSESVARELPKSLADAGWKREVVVPNT